VSTTETRSDGGQLTHSSESAWKACPRRFYLQYRLGIVSKWDSEPLRMGSAFHEGLEVLKANGGEDEAASHVHELYDAAECPPYLEAEEFDVERFTAVALVRGYARRYAGDLIVDYVANERKFNLPIINPETGRPTPTFTSAGKIDGIARLPDGRIALVEHKTTSESIELGSDYWRKLFLDAQLSRYVLAARAEGFPVETTIYDVTRKPDIRPRKVTKAEQAQVASLQSYFGLPMKGLSPERETPAMYGARLLNDLITRRDHYFARVEVPRLEHDLNEFQREQWILQQQIRDADLKSRSWGASAYPRNAGACTLPYRCKYIDICRGMTGDPTQEIPDGFRRAEHFHAELSDKKVLIGAESHE
jgi:hypothetical protein